MLGEVSMPMASGLTCSWVDHTIIIILKHENQKHLNKHMYFYFYMYHHDIIQGMTMYPGMHDQICSHDFTHNHTLDLLQTVSTGQHDLHKSA